MRTAPARARLRAWRALARRLPGMTAQQRATVAFACRPPRAAPGVAGAGTPGAWPAARPGPARAWLNARQAGQGLCGRPGFAAGVPARERAGGGGLSTACSLCMRTAAGVPARERARAAGRPQNANSPPFRRAICLISLIFFALWTNQLAQRGQLSSRARVHDLGPPLRGRMICPAP